MTPAAAPRCSSMMTMMVRAAQLRRPYANAEAGYWDSSLTIFLDASIEQRILNQ